MRVLLITATLALTACSTFERSARSGYAARGAAGAVDGFGSGLNGRLDRDAREELGFDDRPLTRDERRALDLRIRVKERETHLSGQRERGQYYKLRGNLKTDRDRLNVLNMPGPTTRARFATTHGLNAPADDQSDEIAAAIEAKDIALGMNQKAVAESWGDPDAVETSGDKIYGVERWRYNRYVSGGEGYRKENRVVYFESGRVTGWERN